MRGYKKMKRLFPLNNQKGMTLIEAMIAIAILTIGIMAAMGMQIRAIGASSTALYRTDANNIGISLLETLKELPFDDDNLDFTGVNPGNLLPATARTFTTAGNFPRMAPFVASVPGAGTIVDRSGITYNLSWAVQENANPPSKTVRVFMTWNSLMGQNRLEMTTVKYNNISL
jgi:type IV pilus assembly protein PilV